MEVSRGSEPSRQLVLDPQLLYLQGDKTPEEALLEKRGCFATLQRYRYNLHEMRPKVMEYDGIVSFLERERRLRSTCPKEVALRQVEKGYSAIQKTLNGHSLNELQEESWSLSRSWWYWSGYLVGSSGPMKRAFGLWRLNPMWYMHPVLVEDCIGRGGCCGLECGCCVSPQRAKSSAGQLGVGHCTLDCGCCLNIREVNLGHDRRDRYGNSFELSDDVDDEEGARNIDECGPYHYRYYLASVWGISVDDPKVPLSDFDTQLECSSEGSESTI